MATDRIFTLDFVDVVRGREADYLAASHSLVGAHGDSILADTAVLQLQATEVAGEWPCVVNVWERSWSTWISTVAGRFTDAGRNTAIESWWQANTEVRTGGLDLVLTGSPGTRSLAEAAPAAAHCSVFVVDTVWLPAGAVDGYLVDADAQLAREAAATGGVLVGAYRTLWRPNVAVTIVGLTTSSAIAAVVGPGDAAGWAGRRAAVVRAADTRVMFPARSNPGRTGSS